MDRWLLRRPAARVAAYPDSPAPRERLDVPENPESLEPQEIPETQENHHSPPASQRRHHRANLVPKDLPAHLAHQARPENLERLEPPDDQEAMLHQARQDLVDLLDPLENWDLKDPPENQEFPLVPKHLHLESLEKPEIKDLPARLDHQDHQDRMDRREHPDQKEPQDPMEHQEWTATLDLLDHLDPLELQERRVSARNTVPPTEEFSSKTERVVKNTLSDLLVHTFVSFVPSIFYFIHSPNVARDRFANSHYFLKY